MGQSGPRVSRHLKILCGAGLLSRLRAGQWVHYRLAREPAAARFLEGLLADLDPSDPLLAPDRARVSAAGISPDEDGVQRLRERRSQHSSGRARAVSASGACSSSARSTRCCSPSAIEVADECTAVAQGRRAAQATSAFVRHEQLSCRVLSS